MMRKLLCTLLLVLVLLLPASAVQAKGGGWVSLADWCVGLGPDVALWHADVSTCAAQVHTMGPKTVEVRVNLQIVRGETLIVDTDNFLRNHAQILNGGQILALGSLGNMADAVIRNSGHIETWILANDGTIINAGYICADGVNMGATGLIRAHAVVSCSAP